MTSYKEINELKNIVQSFNFQIEVHEEKYLAADYDYVLSSVYLNNQVFKLFIYDEFEDLKLGNSLLSLCLVLIELEIYMDEEDYDSWCKQRQIPSANVQVRDYYLELKNMYASIEQIIGVIESPVSYTDFEQNTGIIKYLRELSK